MKYSMALIMLSAFVIGCANPLNRATSDRYNQMCLEAEEAGNLAVASEACYRAYVNVEWGNLGPEVRSERLYNFGRVLRKSGRYEDAKEALSRSLAEEEKLSGKSSVKTGRRMAELAATYIELNQIESGIPYVDRLIPNTEQYSKSEKTFIAALLKFYGDKLLDSNQIEKANLYKSTMAKLGYSDEFFEKVR